MPLIFSYGTLQQDDVQRSTFGRLLHGQRDELHGFEQVLVRIEDPQVVATSGKTHHANVSFNGRNDSRVSGTVFEITDAEPLSRSLDVIHPRQRALSQEALALLKTLRAAVGEADGTPRRRARNSFGCWRSWLRRRAAIATGNRDSLQAACAAETRSWIRNG